MGGPKKDQDKVSGRGFNYDVSELSFEDVTLFIKVSILWMLTG